MPEACRCRTPPRAPGAAQMLLMLLYEEEDTCMSYEEEDTRMSYEEEDTYGANAADVAL